MIDTHSKFFYGHTVDRNSRYLNFSEGGGELSAEIPVTSYTLSELAAAVANALNSTPGVTRIYSVNVDRFNRTVTISADGTFELLVGTGSQSGASVFGLLGFTNSDRTGASIYEGDQQSGSEYKTQFKLQDYIDPENYQFLSDAIINQTATGAVEVVTFGNEIFIQFNLKYITNKPGDGYVIRSNPNGLGDAISFLKSITSKQRFEFMPDEGDPNTFFKCILESTTASRDGIGYKLKELVNQNLRDYYETGTIKLRVV